MSDAPNIIKVDTWNATASSVGTTLGVSVEHKENDKNVFFEFSGKYKSEKGLSIDQLSELAKPKEANGTLVNGNANRPADGFTSRDSASFFVKKVLNHHRTSYHVTISFSGGKDVNGQFQALEAKFTGDGNLREGSGEGTWRRFSVGGDDDGGDKEVVIVSQKAMAKSEENKLTVSSSIDPQNVNLEILTFEGEYGDKKEAITDPGEYESWKKTRAAKGDLKFQAPGFTAGNTAKFKATKGKEIPQQGYEVTIAFTGTTSADGKESTISAEFKGVGDIREGEGSGLMRSAKTRRL